MLDFLKDLDPAWIALFGTLFGGVVLKTSEHWLGKNKTNSEDAKQIRAELRTQVDSQKSEIEALEKEVEEWKQKYYDLLMQHMKIQTELQIALEKIRIEAVESERKLRSLDEQPPSL